MTEEHEIIRILLIEDDREHARIISKAFKRHGEGMVATVAGTLREARALLAEATPHLVIADLRLPDGDGMEILPTDKDSAQFPVVVVTAHGDEQAAVAALKADVLDYVVKSSLNLSDLPRVAGRAVREWRHIIQRKRAEEALQKAHDELERRVEERTAELAEEQRLLKEMFELQERERKLISYEIHDGLAQQLVGAQMRLQAFSQPRNQMPKAAQEAFDGGLQLLAEAMNETRRLISGLRPPILDESGVVTAVDYLVQELNGREELEIEFHHDVQFDRLAAPLESAIFRIVQESLNNACHHSHSDKVRVELTDKNSLARIEVRDWGVGFDPDNVDQNRYGLQGLRERARLFKGRATIESAPGKGTRIIAELPVVAEGDKRQ